MCSYSRSRTCSLSTRLRPSMCDVNTGFTNRPRSPVSGCTRTTGWRTGASAATRSRPSSWKRSNVRARVVDGDERVDEAADARRQRAVGGDEVGPQRVTAALGDLLGGEDRGQRRALGERDVGVPAVVVARAGAAVADAEAVVAAVQHEDLRMVVVEPALQRMGRRQRSEAPTEGDELARRDVLVAEEHDPPAQQGAAHRGDRGVVERRREIERRAARRRSSRSAARRGARSR